MATEKFGTKYANASESNQSVSSWGQAGGWKGAESIGNELELLCKIAIRALTQQMEYIGNSSFLLLSLSFLVAIHVLLLFSVLSAALP